MQTIISDNAHLPRPSWATGVERAHGATTWTRARDLAGVDIDGAPVVRVCARVTDFVESGLEDGTTLERGDLEVELGRHWPDPNDPDAGKGWEAGPLRLTVASARRLAAALVEIADAVES